jgi:hypothetical protein
MKGVAKLPFLLLNLYPRWWRERYGDEMDVMVQGLVEGGRSPLSLSINLFASSVGVWLRGTGAPATREFWTTRTQRSLLVSALTWFAFLPLSVAFGLSNTQHGFFKGGTRVQMSGASTDALHVQRILFSALILSCFVALVGWQILRGALEGQSVRLRWFHMTNRFAMGGILLLSAALFLGQHNSTSSVAETSGVVGGGLLVISWLSLPALIVFMMREGRLAADRLRAEVTVSFALAGLNVLTTFCVASYLFAISRQPVPLPGADYLLFRSSLGGWNAALVVGFVLVAALSVTGAFTARQSYVRARTL